MKYKEILEVAKAQLVNSQNRMDDETGGRWVTTETGNHVHINSEGDPDKGNPNIMSALKNPKRTRAMTPEKARKAISPSNNSGSSYFKNQKPNKPGIDPGSLKLPPDVDPSEWKRGGQMELTGFRYNPETNTLEKVPEESGNPKGSQEQKIPGKKLEDKYVYNPETNQVEPDTGEEDYLVYNKKTGGYEYPSGKIPLNMLERERIPIDGQGVIDYTNRRNGNSLFEPMLPIDGRTIPRDENGNRLTPKEAAERASWQIPEWTRYTQEKRSGGNSKKSGTGKTSSSSKNKKHRK